MNREPSDGYVPDCYNLFDQNRIPENRKTLLLVIERFIIYLRGCRFVLDEKDNLYSKDRKYTYLLNYKDKKKNAIIPMFIEWYKKSWNDYHTLFEVNSKYLTSNLEVYLKHSVRHIPTVQIHTEYVHYLNGMYNMKTQTFYKLDNKYLKKESIYTTNKMNRFYDEPTRESPFG